MTSLSSLLRRPVPVCCALALFSGAACHATPEDAVPLELGADFQAIISSHPPGTHFVIRAGVHRAVHIEPRDGDVISGEPGAVLNGCLELAQWRQEGEWWVHDTPVLVDEFPPGGLGCKDMICAQSQDLYFDDKRLYPVRTLAEVVDDEKWFLDRTAGRIHVRRNPTGRQVEFGGPATTAIDCSPPGVPARQGVIIEDLRIERYPTLPQYGAVRIGGGSTCRRCDIRQAHSYGIQLTGQALVQDCYLYDNGMCGVGGYGVGALVEGCEIAGNVWPIYAGEAWDNGGIKIAGSSDTTIRRCYVHHNHGPGIWNDIMTRDLVIEDNIVEFNDWEGIIAEISDHITIRRNICRWNGVDYRGENEGALWGGQICVQNANFIEISDNYLECGPDVPSAYGSGQGVMVINQVDRAWDEGVFGGDFGVRNIHVHHNTTLTLSSGHAGVDYGTLGWETYADFLQAELSWHDNRYLAARPLDQRWSWRLGGDWDATVALWLRWEDWRFFQDEGSTLETFGPDRFPPTGTRQWAVMAEVTGHDYPALKRELTRRPAPDAADGDGDGLPDSWELDYLGSVASFSAGDNPDGDEWDNARELIESTSPVRRDTDADGLDDSWEPARGLDPLVFDSDVDSDLDARSALEEHEDGSDPAVAQALDVPVSESHLSLWLETEFELVAGGDGKVQSWIEHSPHRRPVWWGGVPTVSGTSATGRPLVDPGAFVACPVGPGFWGTSGSGFTMVFVFQPTLIDLSVQGRAVLTNETPHLSGFRLRLQAGYLVLSSGQGGGTVLLAGPTRLQAGRTYVISISCGGPGGRSALYLDGQVEAWQGAGSIVPSSNFLMLGNTGGVAPQPCRFGDVVVFRRALSHRARRTVERFLAEKFLTGFSSAGDRDLDGLTDTYEFEHELDPSTPDAQGDEDRDGLTNLSEAERGTDPREGDSDADGLSDGYEVEQGLDPLEQNDSDDDGLPDVWEMKYFGDLSPDAGQDPDADDWDNAREFAKHTDPRLTDTDRDGLPDGWEPAHGTDPTVADSDVDADLDGRSVREEFDDGTDPAVADALDQPVPETNLSLWLETESGLTRGASGVFERWIEHSPHRRPAWWAGTPAVAGASPTAQPLVDPGDLIACPGDPAFWGTPSSGFTMVFVYQPTAIDPSGDWRAILTNESYGEAGFRLRLVAGRLVFDSGQSGGNLFLAATSPLEAGRCHVISISYGGPGGRHSLYLDGRLEAWESEGLVVPGTSFLMLGNTGGVPRQAGWFGDVVVFDRFLSHRERRTVEYLLAAKFLTGFPPTEDRDLDGMPDTWESGRRLDPATPDGHGDEDKDGAVNSVEFQKGTDPLDADTDDDRLPDGWEVDHGLDPLVNDAGGDPDGDGATNLAEFEQGTDPLVSSTVAVALNFPRMRLWWRPDAGLEVAGGAATRWGDSGTYAHDGLPVPQADGPAVSPARPDGLRTVIGSSRGLRTAGDVDLTTLSHAPGLTLAAVVEPPAAAGTPGTFLSLLTVGAMDLGAMDGKPMVRLPGDVTLLAAPTPLPSRPVVLSMTLPAAPAKARLYADGELVAEAEGRLPVLKAPIQVGALAQPWAAELGELMVFAGVLSAGDRQQVERVLAGKWQGTGTLAGDADSDGLPDWWEWQATTDPTVADATGDADSNGVSNLAAFQQGRPAFLWLDADHDGMHDGWEHAHGLDPERDDASLDFDGDGLVNGIEHALGTKPNAIGDDPDAWAVVPARVLPAVPMAVTFWNSHRSWRNRAGLETSDSLAPGSWRVMPTPEPATPPADAISAFVVPLHPAAGGPPVSLFRLRLVTE